MGATASNGSSRARDTPPNWPCRQPAQPLTKRLSSIKVSAMKQSLALALLFCRAFAAAPAAAQTDASAYQGPAGPTGSTPHSTFGVAAKVSTLGVQIEAAKPILNHANIRFGFNVFGLSENFDNDGIDLVAELNLR